MKITVIGAGNIGTLMAAELAVGGHEVSVYTSKPDVWNSDIQVYEIKDNQDVFVTEGHVHKFTSDMKEALNGAEYVFVTVPAMIFGSVAKKMLPYVNSNMRIGVVPGSGGAEFAFSEIIKKGATLFGFQRVHSIARMKEKGKSVYMLGRKDELQIASIPANMCESICIDLEAFFRMPCQRLPHYLCVTLTPSNPILHTTRLYAMFRDYKVGDTYPENILFYESWDNASSEMLIRCDDELQQLCEVIPFDLSSVKSLKVHYESPTVEAMTNKIRSISAFAGLTSPMKYDEERKGWVPDFESRYFTADFSFGLKILIDLAKEYGVETPGMLEVWNWYTRMNPQNAAQAFSLNMKKEQIEHM